MPAAWSRLAPLQNKRGQVGIADQIGQLSGDIVFRDGHRLALAIGRRETDFVEQALHDRVQAPCADILDRIIHLHSKVSERVDRSFIKLKLAAYSCKFLQSEGDARGSDHS